MDDDQYWQKAEVRIDTDGEGEGSKTKRTEVPRWPGALAPSPADLRWQFERAIDELYIQRDTTRPEGHYPHSMREAAFSAFYNALSASCGAIVCDAHPEGQWAQNHPERRDVQVLASAPGSGKTTLAKAFAVALARLNKTHPYPLGTVFLVHHIATADAFYRELSSLLPIKSVAVFTSKHDASRDGVDGGFTVTELEKFPVLVVTHEFYMGIRGANARDYTKGDLRFPRVVTFIDERASEIAIFDMDPHGFEGVLKFIQTDYHVPEEMLDAMRALQTFVSDQRYGERQIETPDRDRASWDAAISATAYLRGDEAARYARFAATHAGHLAFEEVFGFVGAMAEDRAFIVRQNKGKNGVNFMGYERALPQVPGMVLLDATADIDGVSEIVAWRRHADTPTERYANLEVHSVPSVATSTLRRWLGQKGNLRDYIDHVRDLILSHVDPGQKVLVVCLKQVVAAKDISGWSEHMKSFLERTLPEHDGTIEHDETEFTDGFAWLLEGRQVVFTWFGGYGIGANLWRDADVVIVCDDFHLPQRSIKALLQGLRGHRATEGFLADAGDTWPDQLKALQDGHILRWLKQMALRGKARQMDGEGNCGHQKLVVTGDLIRVLAHRPEVFPSAKIIIEEVGEGTVFERLVRLLLQTKESQLSTAYVAKHLGGKWENLSSNLKRSGAWDTALEAVGWQYFAGRGRSPGRFQRRTGPT